MALPGADIIPMPGMEDKAVISVSGNGIDIAVNIDGEISQAMACLLNTRQKTMWFLVAALET